VCFLICGICSRAKCGSDAKEEVRTYPSPVPERTSWGRENRRGRADYRDACTALVRLYSSPVVQILCRTTANFRASATLALPSPRR
jgi:hypothetical protein